MPEADGLIADPAANRPLERLAGLAKDKFAARADELKQGWQTAFIPHYAASFLGAAEAAYEYAVEYLKHQGKTDDPYVQQRVGSMAVNVRTGHLWLRHVADLWDERRRQEAQLAGSQAQHLIEHLAEETVHHCIRACGARSLVRPSSVERILRDLTFYQRHDNDDHIRATIGRAVLNQEHDLPFTSRERRGHQSRNAIRSTSAGCRARRPTPSRI